MLKIIFGAAVLTLALSFTPAAQAGYHYHWSHHSHSSHHYHYSYHWHRG
jgi:hypothetical protein